MAMTKSFLILFVAPFVVLMNSCQPTTSNETPSAADTTGSHTNDSNSVKKPFHADTLPGTDYAAGSYSKPVELLVRTYLQNSNKNDIAKGIVDSLSRKFIFFEYDLNDDGAREIFVGLTGPYFCGSGGCTTLLLGAEGALITKFTVSERPFVISSEKTNTWKDLIVESNGRNHILKYGKKGYPSNPSVQPVLNDWPEGNLPKALNDSEETYPWFTF
jgi:hypothetical protein